MLLDIYEILYYRIEMCNLDQQLAGKKFKMKFCPSTQARDVSKSNSAINCR